MALKKKSLLHFFPACNPPCLLTLHQASANISLLIILMHGSILPNVTVTHSLSSSKRLSYQCILSGDTAASYRDRTAPAESSLLVMKHPAAIAAQWPSCPFQPRVSAQTFLKPPEMTGP